MAIPDKLNPYRSPSANHPLPKATAVNADINDAPDLNHVLQSLCSSNEMRSNRGEDPHVSARELCDWVLSLACKMTAYDKTGAEAVAYLRELNLATSEDVGRAIQQLQAMGLSNASERDKPDDFIAIFNLNLPESQWTMEFNFVDEVNQYEIVDFECDEDQ